MDPATIQFFYDLHSGGEPTVDRRGTAVTLNDLTPFAPTPWGDRFRIERLLMLTRRQRGVRSKTVMLHYLMNRATAETIVDGWLMTGDWGDRFDGASSAPRPLKHDRHQGGERHPEDIETLLKVGVKELCVLRRTSFGASAAEREELVIVLHPRSRKVGAGLLNAEQPAAPISRLSGYGRNEDFRGRLHEDQTARGSDSCKVERRAVVKL
jgi:hypothetical protein